MDSSQNIKISFVIPMYNAEKYIEQCIDSILEISISEIEIIVVNDGSTDNSPAIVKRYAEQDSRICMVSQSNMGLAAARNTGLSVIKGNYLAFIDSDDWILPTYLEQIYHLASSCDAEIVSGQTQYVYANGRTSFGFARTPENIKHKLLKGTECFYELVKYGAYAPMAYNYIYKTSWIKGLHLQFRDVIHEDELWTAIALTSASRAIATDIIHYMYRQHDDSIMYNINIQKRIVDLIFISNELINHIIKTDTKDTVFLSYFLLNILNLYRLAFTNVLKIRNSDFSLPQYSLDYFYSCLERISDEIKPRYNNYLKSINSSINQYQNWLNSELVVDLEEKDLKEKKIVLIFNIICEEPSNISKEQIPQEFIFTTDRRYFNDAYAILFYLPTLNNVLAEDLNKPDNQKWIAWSMESDENYPFQKDPEFMELFDYRMTYNMDADVVYPYYKYKFLEIFRKPSNISSKNSDICMMISSGTNLSSRQEYLKELMQYVDIDSYGRLFNNIKLENDTGTDAKLELYSKYKFVIAFENSCTEDYVTEKFYCPIIAGAVPIYFGAHNIDEFAPGENSYINVRNFKSPKKLADFLIKCCHDNTLYETFFEWKKKPYLPSFEQKVIAIEQHPFVRLCRVLSKKEDILFTEIQTECDV